MTKRAHIEHCEAFQIAGGEYDIVLAYISFQSPFDVLAPETDKVINLLLQCILPSGLLFIYGDPATVPYYATALEQKSVIKDFIFRYYIGVRTTHNGYQDKLNEGHKALILYASKNKLALSKIRIPHLFCRSCGCNVRDWGGKGHLMHPAGTALSDVWKDLCVRPEEDLPQTVLDRIVQLSPKDNPNILLVKLPAMRKPLPAPVLSETVNLPQEPVELNKVVLGDCVEVMQKLPSNFVDLAFADPPYNLTKNYFVYDDTRHDEEYLAWCERWLYEYQRILKPTGSLFVVNLPKWAIHHKVFLDKYLYFQNWIVWDALSEPRGKLMPAHYSILYYTKHPSRYTFNPEWAKQLATDFCLRASCIKRRHHQGVDDNVPLSDIWWDIPRIKHKKFRDTHPCQLPEKLMERIIGLTSNPGDIVFDGFCGAGTTALVAKKMSRQFLTIDIDKYYVDLTLKKLDFLDKWGTVPRMPIPKRKLPIPKKELQLELLRLANELGRLPTEEDVNSHSKYPLGAFLKAFPSFGKALRAAKVHKGYVHTH